MGGTPNLLESNVRNSKGFLLGEPIGTILWLLGFGLAEVIIAKQNWNSYVCFLFFFFFKFK